MSLDVYLKLPEVKSEGSGIFVRENGSNREITRAEWDERFPGREPLLAAVERDDVYSANITGNLATMADKAGLYEVMWRPDENGYEYAHQIIDVLLSGLTRLQANPEFFSQFNPSNGWGDYEGLVSFTWQYLKACRQYPNASISVSR